MSNRVMLDKIERRLTIYEKMRADYNQPEFEHEHAESNAVIEELKYLLDWFKRKGKQYGKEGSSNAATSKTNKRSRSRK